MIPLPKPTIDKIDIYDKCVLSISNSELREIISNYKYIYLLNASSYDFYADKKSFHQLSEIILPVINHKNFSNYNIVKDELIKLYSKLCNNKEPILYYNQICSASKLSKCPFCGFGQVTTVDHYLPKSKFPIFSILPYNLVPCCRDCNSNKGDKYTMDADSQPLHPYYDGDILSERLIFAKVIEQNPISMEFYVQHSNKIYENRTKIHFEIYDLPKRFAVEAAERVTELNTKFMEHSGNMNPIDIKQELYAEFERHKALNPNSWKTAMYEALYKSNWYCQGGYKQII